MNDSRENMISNSTTIQSEKTPLLIGLGVLIRGEVIDETGDPESRMIILGRVQGNITTKGIVQIAKGAVVEADSTIDAGEIVVSGSLIGKGVTVRTDLLVLQSTGSVDVESVLLPPGGLEQMRGGVLNARLDMSAELRSAVRVAAVKEAPAVSAFRSVDNRVVPVLLPTAIVSNIHSTLPFSARASAFESEVDLPEDDAADSSDDGKASKAVESSAVKVG